MLTKSLIFVCGLALGVLMYDTALERAAPQVMPSVECVWISSPVKHGNELRKCYVVGRRWSR